MRRRLISRILFRFQYNYLNLKEENCFKELIRFGYKINRLYLNPLMSNYLDNGLIDYEVIEFLKQLNSLHEKNYIPTIKIRTDEYDYEFLRRDTTRAFFEENILFFHKYNKLVTTQHYIYNHFIRNIYPSMLSKILHII